MFLDNQIHKVRPPNVNRLLAREAVTAYKERREPDFKSILKCDLKSANGVLSLVKYRMQMCRKFRENFDPALN